MDRLVQIDTFNRIAQVSRETISSLIKYEDLLIHANKSLNLIGNSTIDQIWTRHFLDSYQVIDFIDKNDISLADIGSGAGFPGIVIALAAKDKKIPLKIKLIEKSPKKTKFLETLINELNLKVQIVNENVLVDEIKIEENVIVARAFKPIEKIFQLIHKKTHNWKKILIFLGKTGQGELLQASKVWDIKYKQRVSVTNSDSSIIEVNKLKKKN